MRRWFAFLLMVAVVASCGGDGSAGTAGSPAASASTVTSSTSTVEDHAECGVAFVAGLSTVECEGLSFDVAVPEICLEGSCGVIVDVPGAVGTAAHNRLGGMMWLLVAARENLGHGCVDRYSANRTVFDGFRYQIVISDPDR